MTDERPISCPTCGGRRFAAEWRYEGSQGHEVDTDRRAVWVDYDELDDGSYGPVECLECGALMPEDLARDLSRAILWFAFADAQLSKVGPDADQG
jgi:hypothetical protein